MLLTMGAGVAAAEGSEFEESMVLRLNGKPWMSTVTTSFDKNHADRTYKVYSHLYDFDGSDVITKGAGGQYPHHRGLYIGWIKTLVGGKSWDTWVMTNATQRHSAWLELEAGVDSATQVEEVNWCDDEGKPFVREIRAINVWESPPDKRVFDFQSTLHSLAGEVQLKGDPHHGGMHVRLANEVAENATDTVYILPEGAVEGENEIVKGAWWVCCNAKVRGKAWWVMHLTPPDHPMGQPVYSMRRYGRFGAFVEPVLEQGKPLVMEYRIVVSSKPLDLKACQAIYDAYAGTR